MMFLMCLLPTVRGTLIIHLTPKKAVGSLLVLVLFCNSLPFVFCKSNRITGRKQGTFSVRSQVASINLSHPCVAIKSIRRSTNEFKTFVCCGLFEIVQALRPVRSGYFNQTILGTLQLRRKCSLLLQSKDASLLCEE